MYDGVGLQKRCGTTRGVDLLRRRPSMHATECSFEGPSSFTIRGNVCTLDWQLCLQYINLCARYMTRPTSCRLELWRGLSVVRKISPLSRTCSRSKAALHRPSRRTCVSSPPSRPGAPCKSSCSDTTSAYTVVRCTASQRAQWRTCRPARKQLPVLCELSSCSRSNLTQLRSRNTAVRTVCCSLPFFGEDHPVCRHERLSYRTRCRGVRVGCTARRRVRVQLRNFSGVSFAEFWMFSCRDKAAKSTNIFME